jgi:hypothetical protein
VYKLACFEVRTGWQWWVVIVAMVGVAVVLVDGAALNV